MTGFEPATTSTPCWYATGLRYTPNMAGKVINKTNDMSVRTTAKATFAELIKAIVFVVDDRRPAQIPGYIYEMFLHLILRICVTSFRISNVESLVANPVAAILPKEHQTPVWVDREVFFGTYRWAIFLRSDLS